MIKSNTIDNQNITTEMYNISQMRKFDNITISFPSAKVKVAHTNFHSRKDASHEASISHQFLVNEFRAGAGKVFYHPQNHNTGKSWDKPAENATNVSDVLDIVGLCNKAIFKDSLCLRVVTGKGIVSSHKCFTNSDRP